MRTTLRIRRTLGLALTALTTVAVTGCGGDTGHDTAAPAGGGHGSTTAPATGSSSAAAGTTAHNQADATFAQSMILHHKQAIEMATMGEKASNAEVKALAAKITSTQQPEIDTMTTWLTTWDAPMPSADAGGHGMPGMSDSEMPGMMTDKDMASLKNATGAAFDKMFLEMMIEHHQGAVAMAGTQQEQGQNADAKALAETIKADQSAEIKQMEDLLSKQ